MRPLSESPWRLVMHVALAVMLTTVMAAVVVPARSAAASLDARLDADGDGALDSDEDLLGRDLSGARVVYVAPDGSDKADGTWERPLLTLREALSAATGGEAVLVTPGLYPETMVTRDYSKQVAVYGLPRAGKRPEVAGLELGVLATWLCAA